MITDFNKLRTTIEKLGKRQAWDGSYIYSTEKFILYLNSHKKYIYYFYNGRRFHRWFHGTAIPQAFKQFIQLTPQEQFDKLAEKIKTGKRLETTILIYKLTINGHILFFNKNKENEYIELCGDGDMKVWWRQKKEIPESFEKYLNEEIIDDSWTEVFE